LKSTVSAVGYENSVGADFAYFFETTLNLFLFGVVQQILVALAWIFEH